MIVLTDTEYVPNKMYVVTNILNEYDYIQFNNMGKNDVLIQPKYIFKYIKTFITNGVVVVEIDHFGYSVFIPYKDFEKLETKDFIEYSSQINFPYKFGVDYYSINHVRYVFSKKDDILITQQYKNGDKLTIECRFSEYKKCIDVDALKLTETREYKTSNEYKIKVLEDKVSALEKLIERYGIK